MNNQNAHKVKKVKGKYQGESTQKYFPLDIHCVTQSIIVTVLHIFLDFEGHSRATKIPKFQIGIFNY